MCRRRRGRTAFYFACKARSFSDGSRSPVGFESDANVTLLVEGSAGQIVSPGTRVKLYSPGVASVTADGKKLTVAGRGTGWIAVRVPAGTHALKLSKMR